MPCAGHVTLTEFAATGTFLRRHLTMAIPVSSHAVGRSALRTVAMLCFVALFVDAASAEPAHTTFSGRATVVQATVLGNTVTLADTGPLPASGGAQQASLLDAQVPGLLTAEVLHASTVGQGNTSRSEASVANLSLTVGGHTVTAGFLMARATATCNGSN